VPAAACSTRRATATAPSRRLTSPSGGSSSRKREVPRPRRGGPARERGRHRDGRGYYLLDLFARYRWRNLELSLQLLNLTNTDWREAQFADNSCVRSEEQSRNLAGPCYVKPGKSPARPADSIHFTPGNPIGVVGGLTWFF
jgi:outer membrane receptor protein involved in Fe transport